jgi:hypothetical protein
MPLVVLLQALCNPVSSSLCSSHSPWTSLISMYSKGYFMLVSRGESFPITHADLQTALQSSNVSERWRLRLSMITPSQGRSTHLFQRLGKRISFYTTRCTQTATATLLKVGKDNHTRLSFCACFLHMKRVSRIPDIMTSTVMWACPFPHPPPHGDGSRVAVTQ